MQPEAYKVSQLNKYKFATGYIYKVQPVVLGLYNLFYIIYKNSLPNISTSRPDFRVGSSYTTSDLIKIQ